MEPPVVVFRCAEHQVGREVQGNRVGVEPQRSISVAALSQERKEEAIGLIHADWCRGLHKAQILGRQVRISSHSRMHGICTVALPRVSIVWQPYFVAGSATPIC